MLHTKAGLINLLNRLVIQWSLHKEKLHPACIFIQSQYPLCHS